jgi:hypothetical protein
MYGNLARRLLEGVIGRVCECRFYCRTLGSSKRNGSLMGSEDDVESCIEGQIMGDGKMV